MKSIIQSMILFLAILTSTQAQFFSLNLSGNVTDVNSGAPVPNHSVFAVVMSGGIIQNFVYLTSVSGFYSASIPVYGDGTVSVSTFDCNGGNQSQSATFGPNSLAFIFDFAICTDSTNYGCQAWFGYNNLGNGVVAFFDQSTGNPAVGMPTNWLWDFGDGTTSSLQNPVHAYNGFGIFNVCLTVWDNQGLCQDTHCSEINVNPGGGGCLNWFGYETWNYLDFAFFGESNPPAVYYLWDFGDGQTGTGQTALHTYSPNIGDFVIVTLTSISFDPATGDSCVAVSSQEIWLNNSGNGCENWFWYEQNNATGFNFYGESFPNPAFYYAWDFGDGQFGYGQQVSHNYDPNSGDVFTVILTTLSYGPDGDSCMAVSLQDVWVNGQGNDCYNWFWYANPSPDVFEFHGESFPVPADMYFWDFGDGSTGYGQNITHIYEPGTGEVFMVTLTTLVSNPAFNDSCVAVSYQEVWLGGQTGDCQNWFWYESSGYEYSFHGESFPYPADQYIWQFDNGMVLFGQNVSFTFDPAGGNEHLVCLTTYVFNPNSDSCSYTSCKQILLGGQTGSELSGTVYVSDSIPADFALVGLFGMTPNGGFGYQFTTTEMGMFFFENVPPGNYYIFASLTPQSQYFYDYFPTYYGDAITWAEATLIALGEPLNPYNINLVPLQGVNAGSGLITGNVSLGEGKGDPGVNMTVMLMDVNEDLLAYTKTNSEGLFSFENLAFSTYKLKVEIPGKPSAVATVVLGENNPQDEVIFIVKDTEVVLSASQIPAFVNIVGEIFPNPVIQTANLEINLSKLTAITISIVNQLGQEVLSYRDELSSGTHLLKLETSELKKGFYTMQVKDGQGNALVKKFIK